MDLLEAVTALAALAQENRLTAFKKLVAAGPAGLPAGEISAGLQMPHNSLSFHLSHLKQAGLIQARRQGRQIIYAANFDVIRQLVGYLVENCCRDDLAACRFNAKGTKQIIEFFLPQGEG
jgi:DNA-binding transcriptional ArsR family regulator